MCGDELESDRDAEEHAECALDAQAWSGVFPESLRGILDETRSSWRGGDSGKRQRMDILDDLRASGVAYLDTP